MEGSLSFSPRQNLIYRWGFSSVIFKEMQIHQPWDPSWLLAPCECQRGLKVAVTYLLPSSRIQMQTDMCSEPFLCVDLFAANLKFKQKMPYWETKVHLRNPQSITKLQGRWENICFVSFRFFNSNHFLHHLLPNPPPWTSLGITLSSWDTLVLHMVPPPHTIPFSNIMNLP